MVCFSWIAQTVDTSSLDSSSLLRGHELIEEFIPRNKQLQVACWRWPGCLHAADMPSSTALPTKWWRVNSDCNTCMGSGRSNCQHGPAAATSYGSGEHLQTLAGQREAAMYKSIIHASLIGKCMPSKSQVDSCSCKMHCSMCASE